MNYDLKHEGKEGILCNKKSPSDASWIFTIPLVPKKEYFQIARHSVYYSFKWYFLLIIEYIWLSVLDTAHVYITEITREVTLQVTRDIQAHRVTKAALMKFHCTKVVRAWNMAVVAQWPSCPRPSCLDGVMMSYVAARGTPFPQVISGEEGDGCPLSVGGSTCQVIPFSCPLPSGTRPCGWSLPISCQHWCWHSISRAWVLA